MTALRPKPWQWFCIALFYYALAMTTGRIALTAPVEHGLTFNSMLDHLFEGRFDVDPDTIKTEGYFRNGRTYAYFGILPALLRLPLAGLGLLKTTDVTILYSIVAAALAAYFKVAIIAEIQKKLPATKPNSVLFGVVVMATVFGGPQVQFLKPSIYQESALWGAAIAAAYVFVAVKSLLADRLFTLGRVTWLALLAGLALITRVSVGAGLYLATGFLFLVLAGRGAAGSKVAPALALMRRLFQKEWRPAWAALLFFVVVAGVINYGRFGNPLRFADLRLNGEMQSRPERIQRLIEYGELNPKRIGYALLYYFLPLNVARTSDGRLLFQDFQVRMVDPPELPPSSFFLSDPMLMLLVGIGLWSFVKFRRWGEVRTSDAFAILGGLAVPPVIVCMMIYLAFRYRLDFYPFFDLIAFLGLYAFLRAEVHTSGPSGRRLGKIVEYSALAQIAASHLLLLCYKVSPFGDPTEAIAQQGIFNLYLQVLSRPF